MDLPMYPQVYMALLMGKMWKIDDQIDDKSLKL